MIKSSVLTPNLRACIASSACSASINAQIPPFCCACAMACNASVVFPDDSGPKISMIRPHGNPPTPIASSIKIEPVEITSTTLLAPDCPNIMTAPLPYCLSICEKVTSSAFLLKALVVSFGSSIGSTFLFFILSIRLGGSPLIRSFLL